VTDLWIGRRSSAQRELFSVLRLVDAGKITVSEKMRKASSTTIDVITAVLDGGDYYPFVPAKDKWHDENAGPIRAFAWPLLIGVRSKNFRVIRALRAPDPVRNLFRRGRYPV
jgi:hypothetical protein